MASALAEASGEPEPIATETLAFANSGASLMPSPIAKQILPSA